MKKYLIILLCFVILISSFFLYKIFTDQKEKNLKEITVSEVTHSIFYAPFYVAIENGYFKDKGININLILTPGADNVMAAVLSNDADIGLSGSEATIYIYNTKEKDYIKTFAQLTQKDGSFIIAREKNDNFTLNDLKGKYIIGGRSGGMPEMTLEWSLKNASIDPKKDLYIDTSVSFANMASSFISGVGDYVTLFEPQATTIEKEGYGYKVAQLGVFGGNIPYTAFNAKISFIEENKSIINDFTEAIEKGLKFTKDNDSKTIAEIIKNQFPDNNIEDLIKAIDAYKENDTWPANSTFTKESFDHLQEILEEAGYLDNRVSFADLVYVK